VRKDPDTTPNGSNGSNGKNGVNGITKYLAEHALRIPPVTTPRDPNRLPITAEQAEQHVPRLIVHEQTGKLTVTTRQLLEKVLDERRQSAQKFYEMTRFDNGTSLRFGRVQALALALVKDNPSVPRVLFYSLVEDLKLGSDQEQVTEKRYHELLQTIDTSILAAAEKALDPEGFEALQLPLEDRRRIAAILRFRIENAELEYVVNQVFEVLQEVVAEVSKANTERDMAKMFGPQDLTVGKEITEEDEDESEEVTINQDMLIKLLGTKRAGQLLLSRFDEDLNPFTEKNVDDLVEIFAAERRNGNHEPIDQIPQAEDLDAIEGSVYSDDDLYGWLQDQEGNDDNDFLGDLPDWMRE